MGLQATPGGHPQVQILPPLSHCTPQFPSPPTGLPQERPFFVCVSNHKQVKRLATSAGGSDDYEAPKATDFASAGVASVFAALPDCGWPQGHPPASQARNQSIAARRQTGALHTE